MASSGLPSTTLLSVRATLRDERASSGRTAEDAFHGIDTDRSGSIDESEFGDCTHLAKRPRLALDHATAAEEERTGAVGSLQLRRLVSLDAGANESVGASKRLAWMLLGDIHSWARMALSLDVQIKVGSGCVLRTWRFTHGALVLRSIVFDAPVAIIARSACRTRVCWMWSTKMNCHTTC